MGGHQALLHRAPAAVPDGVLQQLVRLKGVGVPQQVEPVLQTRLGCRVGHPTQQPLGLLRLNALALMQVVDAAAGEVDGRVVLDLERVEGSLRSGDRLPVR
ncbi:MAG TPA: hypothetical protein VIU11_18990 [Nakamurella sp.]